MNIAQAIMHLFPQANLLQDFLVQDDSDGKGPYIAQWNLDAAQPTEEELQAAWEAYQAAEASKPPVLTAEQQISALQAENAKLKNDNVATMEAVAEVYEMLLKLQGGE